MSNEVWRGFRSLQCVPCPTSHTTHRLKSSFWSSTEKMATVMVPSVRADSQRADDPEAYALQDGDIVIVNSTIEEPLLPEDRWEGTPYRYRTTSTYRNFAGYACCFCLVLFFLLFFLIPRTPEFSSDFNTSIVSTNPFIMQQTYSVYNPNPYSLTVDSIKTMLVTQASIDIGGILTTFPVVGLGSFPPGVKEFTVPSTGWNDMAIYYNLNTTANSGRAISANVAQCCKSDSTFVTTGSFDMSTSVHDYDGVSLGTLLTLVTCEGPRCQ